METISIAVICTVLGVAISYMSFQRNKDNYLRAETREVTQNNAKLDYISKGVDDIRLDFKDQARKINGINERLIRVEESAKSAHKRIDECEKGEM